MARTWKVESKQGKIPKVFAIKEMLMVVLKKFQEMLIVVFFQEFIIQS